MIIPEFPSTDLPIKYFARPVVQRIDDRYSIVVTAALMGDHRRTLAVFHLVDTWVQDTDESWPVCHCGCQCWVSAAGVERDNYAGWSCGRCSGPMDPPVGTISKRRALSPLERGALIERFGRACFYCGRHSGSLTEDPDGQPWNVDHTMPLALGGSNDIDNLALSCHACNHKKSAMHPREFRP